MLPQLGSFWKKRFPLKAQGRNLPKSQQLRQMERKTSLEQEPIVILRKDGHKKEGQSEEEIL
ncbi:MAG: hypothetical protein UT58_C0011G0022 [Microgenomates group bacterium GW2011_GWC1_39_7b]|uniref:Uncharacterized protein n=3 Tax=Candidatus Woeseibacteriota TaxID=1752722 RepID=A0A0G0P233_9BACT|nr:MAG: hypothetical protein UT17_C0003G0167 [Candidatus Woesebacteria bacterium GW2011_GWB1_39_10]KKR26523.1 MAG: hypothetical protein UT58_C0011G0022 [Microgenomates group bacterium GW2011_GWC1_39_7b]KKR73580.1 MAG: hypothetical protein UU16_C0018G0005 [Candidatus Woesebacteria bacterium GW2011_GWA2_40_7]KKS91104.1 MAG: hypothetical protein UV66_C0001G0461 [Candidatus Woesebacteria bacterium GW2011_GWA1_43_12]